MDGESDDPEEQRRLIEARESAQNFGAIAGLVAGVAVALTRDQQLAEEQWQVEEQEQQAEQTQQQTM